VIKLALVDHFTNDGGRLDGPRDRFVVKLTSQYAGVLSGPDFQGSIYRSAVGGPSQGSIRLERSRRSVMGSLVELVGLNASNRDRLRARKSVCDLV
jgi:hypothetical protein